MRRSDAGGGSGGGGGGDRSVRAIGVVMTTVLGRVAGRDTRQCAYRCVRGVIHSDEPAMRVLKPPHC